jgi:hypothetical protein
LKQFEFHKGASLSDLKREALEFVKKDPSLQNIKDLEMCKIDNSLKKVTYIYHNDGIKKQKKVEIETVYKENNEIAFFGKEIEEKKDYLRIFVHFAHEERENNKSSLKAISYPLYFYIKNDTTLKQLKEMIIERLELTEFISKDNINRSSKPKDKYKILDLNMMHKEDNTKCNLCNKNYDTNCYCSVYKIMKDKDKLGNYFDSNISFLATSEYFNYGKLIYNNSPLLIYDFDSSMNKNDFSFGLKELISSFNEEEILQEDNKWYCSECRGYQSSTKKMQIHKSPHYLIIHLKRFKINNQIGNNESRTSNFHGEKNKAYIIFPTINLDISEYVNEPNNQKEIYDLYGIIQHYGNISSGHYKAICKNNDKWISYNDDEVEEITSPVNENAYILFYKRKNLDKFYD